MLERAVRGGAGADLRGAARARRADRRLRLQLPLGDAGRLRGDGHRGGGRPALDQRHELVPPARAALRRVRLLAGGDADRRRLPRPLRPRLQHEPRPPQPRGRDPLRAARRRRRADRLHPVPDLPRPPPPPGLARGPAAPRGRDDPAQVPPPHLGTGRALLRRPLRQPRGALQVDLDPRQPRRLLGLRAPPSWSAAATTTSCSSRCPTTTTTRTATGRRRASSRSPRPTTASPSWSRRGAGWRSSSPTTP